METIRDQQETLGVTRETKMETYGINEEAHWITKDICSIDKSIMGAPSRVSNATKLKTHGVFKETTQEQYAVVKEISWKEA